MPFNREATLRNAEKLLRQGRLDLAIAEYRAVVDDQPSDWNTANTLGDLYFRAGQVDKAVTEYSQSAAHLASEGFFPKAVALYRKILKIKPDDERAMWHLGGIAARQGLLVDARANYLALAARRRARGDHRGEAEVVIRLGDLDGADIETVLAGARARAELGEVQAAVERLKNAAEVLQTKGKDAEAVRLLTEAARIDPQEGVAEPSAEAEPKTDAPEPDLWTRAEAELRAGRIPEGTAVLQQILAADPSRRDAIVALGCAMAEGHLAAAYECVDFVAREAIAADDWSAAAAAFTEFVRSAPTHIPALMRLVEICVDGGLEAPMHHAQAQLADAYLAIGAGLEARVIAEDLVAREPWEPANIERFRSALTLLGETDIDALIAERLNGQPPFIATDPPRPVKPLVRAQSLEIDLSDVLHRLGHDIGTVPARPAAPIEAVLDGMRREAARDATTESAEQHFKVAGTYLYLGMQLEAMRALEVAAQSVGHRFRAGAMLGQAYLKSGDLDRAIEWYERAAEAPPPSPAAHHALLYELATLLETRGEGARALAVWLELQSDAGDYRDVSARLEQLKVQMGS